MHWQPWDDYPGLTFDRLRAVAELIRNAREGAADDHRPEMSETNWSLGVRAYERTCGAVRLATPTHPWLHVVAGHHGGPVHFVMSIGGHAVRFYRGSPDHVPDRYRHPSFPELTQQMHALELDGKLPLGRSLRIVIENDKGGRPSSISLVEISDDTGIATNTFLIPGLPALNQAAVARFVAANEPPAHIPPVSAEPLEDECAADGTTDKRTGSGDE